MKKNALLVTLFLTLTLIGCASGATKVVTVPRAPSGNGTYPVAGTGTECPAPSIAPSYKDNGDGTVSDLVTGLMWTQSPDLNADGVITSKDKLAIAEAASKAGEARTGGYSDWRLPTIKELYSLITFNGVDPRLEDTDSRGLTPFIDTRYFKFAYGDIKAGERIIDAQFATSSMYVGQTGGPDMQTMFGVNFADGRIKGYGIGPTGNKKFFVYYVRGNLSYGVNNFRDNADGTITDLATTLMWAQCDSGTGMDWEKAQIWASKKNAEKYSGHDDWRLPTAKELQSLVDYTRAPGVTNSAAIDPLFQSTMITNEAAQEDYGCYWS